MNIRSLAIVLLLACLAALSAACRPIQQEVSGEQPPVVSQVEQETGHTGSGTVAPTDPVEVQIENAMSAAPPAIARDATILGFPIDEGGDMVVLRQGTNAWTCYTDWPVSPGNDPACYDATFEAWNAAYHAGENPAVTATGMAYMLAGGSDPSNTDPMAMEPAAGKEWITTPPHLMIVVPGDLDPAVFTTDHHSGYPYIMWEGTPYEHLMLPVVPAVSPSNGPLTSAASAEEQIRNMRSAAPAAVVDNATLMGYPSEEGGDLVVLREGSNGWTCFPDRLVSPGNDPFCDDATADEGFTAGTTRSVAQLGVSYMLAGGSDASNTDPTAASPAEGEDWISTPAHVMLLAPGGFAGGSFSVEHASGEPYVMFRDTDFEHLMVPVVDMHAPAASAGH
jgi:hypothetical protein